MKSNALTVEEYLDQIQEDRKTIMGTLRSSISNHLPPGFKETMAYGMIAYVVPHSIYPNGYHCDPKMELPFVSLASQKNHISIYHMGLYAQQPLMIWFEEQWKSVSSKKLDMGKGCIRFKKPEEIPVNLIGELMGKISVREWIQFYEQNLKK